LAFTIKIHHDARSSECKKKKGSVCYPQTQRSIPQGLNL